MGKTTGISWCSATWNPWQGCTKVSPGCKFCYMYDEKTRYKQDPTVVVRSKTTFRDPLKWKEPEIIFTCSWSDFFHEAADPWRTEAWDVIRQTPRHTYLVLTKRPERIERALPADWGQGWPNVWLGTSAENQKQWDERLGYLCAIPSVVRFVSAEPLLGHIDAGNAFDPPSEPGDPFGPIDWVILGGESGPNARPCDINWIRDLKNQCELAGVACFVKQLGSKPYVSAHSEHSTGSELVLKAPKGDDFLEWPLDLRMQAWPEPRQAAA